MLAKNKNGWTLLEHLDIAESDICKYHNVTGAYAILMVRDKFVVGFNGWRNQWEFPAGGIEEGKVEDAKGTIKYQAIFVGCQNELSPFIHEENDEMEKNISVGYERRYRICR